MPSSYPGGLDNLPTSYAGTDQADVVDHAGMHNATNAAVNAVQAELGTDPSGTEATLAARLAAIEAGTRMAAGAIGTTAIANDAVTADKIAPNAVGSGEIAANAVGSSELADSAVDTTAVADGAVTDAKLSVAKADKLTVGNLLTDNQARPTTTGGWTLVNCTESSAGVFTASGATAYYVFTDIAVTAEDTYTLLVSHAPTGRLVVAYIDFRNSGGSSVGGFSGAGVAAGTAATSRITATAPTGAVTARVYVANTDPGSGGDAMTLTRASFYKGAGGNWQMPGVPIPNQAVLPVTQIPVPQVKLWAGASWAPQPVIIGSGSPLNVVIPDFKGQEFVDNAQTLGARKWVATGTTSASWRVCDGETPWYDVKSLVTGFTNVTLNRVDVRRRIGVVQYRFSWNAAANASGQGQWATPVGFRYAPSISDFGHSLFDSGVYQGRILTASGASALIEVVPGQNVRATFSHPTDDAWPTSAPV